MNLKKLKCPSCGADIHLKYGSNKTICEYCGSGYIVSEDEKDKIINTFNNMFDKNFTAIKIFKTVFIIWIIIFILIGNEVLILPSFFIDYFHMSDDYYQKQTKIK